MNNTKNILFLLLLSSTIAADEKKEITENVIAKALVEELEKHPVATGAAVITGLLAFDCYRGKDQLPYLQKGFNAVVHELIT